MGFDLRSESGLEFRLTGTAWTVVLHLAETTGWQPRGTQPPAGIDPAEWGGNYDSNEGQTISKEDAAQLAEALVRASLDPQRGDRLGAVAAKISSAVRRATGGDYEIEVEQSFWTTVDELIRFCRKGAARIE